MILSNNAKHSEYKALRALVAKMPVSLERDILTVYRNKLEKQMKYHRVFFLADKHISLFCDNGKYIAYIANDKQFINTNVPKTYNSALNAIKALKHHV